MQTTANLTIYLQALGAHFLGAHAYNNSQISVQFQYSGGTIDIPYIANPNFTDDGNTTPHFVSGASSFMPVITVPQAPPASNDATINFLTADYTTIAGRGILVLPDTLEYATITVSIPTTAMDAAKILTQQVLLSPGIPNYQITVIVQGLYLEPVVLPGNVAVFVKMMCGCPVTMGPPASLWPANDFTVYANVTDENGVVTAYPMSYANPQATNSLFTALLSATQNAPAKIIYTALQKSTGNYGVVVQHC
jgi:hypothetical protein